MNNIPEQIRGKRFFITGATGLIGRNLVRYLAANGAEVLALSRRPTEGVPYVLGDVRALPAIEGNVDYIIHAASATASAFFADHPAETIDIAVQGTRNVLELAREKRVRGLVYLSSMEVYGFPEKGHKVTEDEVAGFDPTAARSSYPISKQLCEAMCCAYAKEYAVPAKIVRLTQTFGPGVRYDDSRVFAEFMRCAVEKKDIVLKTKGETERCYLYTDDAVQAILTVLLYGAAGEAYTAANPETYCSIAEMAEMLAKEYGIGVNYTLEDAAGYGYADTMTMRLSVNKLMDLGWKPSVGLPEAFRKMIDCAERENERES